MAAGRLDRGVRPRYTTFMSLRAFLERHRPGPLAGAVVGAFAFWGLMQIFPALGCG